jgi:hypothetical protein
VPPKKKKERRKCDRRSLLLSCQMSSNALKRTIIVITVSQAAHQTQCPGVRGRWGSGPPPRHRFQKTTAELARNLGAQVLHRLNASQVLLRGITAMSSVVALCHLGRHDKERSGSLGQTHFLPFEGPEHLRTRLFSYIVKIQQAHEI